MSALKFMLSSLVLVPCLLLENATAEPVKAAPEQIALWVAELESESFEARRKAMEQLREIGAPAAKVLADVAAKTQSAEVRKRCFELLGDFLNSDQEAVQQAARKSLKQLAQSDDKAIAGRADAALHPAQENGQADAPVQVRNLKIMAQGQIQIQARPLPAQVRAFVRQPKVEVTEDKSKGIIVKVTPAATKQNPKPEAKEYKASSLDELKEKYPEGFKQYINYKFREQNKVQVKGGNIQARVRPLVIQARPAIPAAQEPDELDLALEGIENTLQFVAKQVRTRRAAGQDISDLQQLITELKATRTKLEAMKDASDE